jgi:hypothetical protein
MQVVGKLSTKNRCPSLLDKTLFILRNSHVKRLSRDCYLVRAESDPIMDHYIVRKVKGVWRCSCRGYEKRGRCSHSLAVFLFEERRGLEYSF